MAKRQSAEWLTTGQAARELGYSIPWVRQKIREGKLEAREYSGGERCSIRISRSSLDRFIERYMD